MRATAVQKSSRRAKRMMLSAGATLLGGFVAPRAPYHYETESMTERPSGQPVVVSVKMSGGDGVDGGVR